MSSFCLYGILFLICAQSVTSFRKGSSVCLLDYDEGICRALIKRFYYDRVNKTCEVFYYGGCLGNRNNFLSKQECEQKCNGTIYIKENSSDSTEATTPTQKPLGVGAKIFLGILDIKNGLSNLFNKVKGASQLSILAATVYFGIVTPD
uniref:Protein AMBP n=2 Tax=Schistosoma TaxID=6181 RepID=A0A095CEH8_SCHHA